MSKIRKQIVILSLAVSLVFVNCSISRADDLLPETESVGLAQSAEHATEPLVDDLVSEAASVGSEVPANNDPAENVKDLSQQPESPVVTLSGEECERGIPALNMTLANDVTLDNINADKEVKWEGQTVTLNSCGRGQDLEPEITQIGGRGNSSWSQPKKGYNIKFDKKKSVLGMPEAKKWTLLPNYIDESQVKNYAAFLLSNESGLYAPKMWPIEWYINGEYHGFYWITEKVEPGENRVAITKKGNCSGDTGGVILEVDNFWYKGEPHYFETLDKTKFVLKETVADDEDDNDSKGLCDYNSFKGKVLDFDNTMRNMRPWDEVKEKIDVDSFAKYYLLTEFFQNRDGYNSSTFMYTGGNKVDDEKIHMGPLWDMDNAMYGTDDHFRDCFAANYTFTNCLLTSRWPDSALNWMLYLLNYPEFRDSVQHAFSEMQVHMNHLISDIDAEQSTIYDAVVRDRQKWGFNGDSSSAVNRVKSFLNTRIAFFNETHGINRIPTYRLRNNETGEYLYTIHFAEREHLRVNGWTDEGFVFYTSYGASHHPVYRMYNLENGRHIYTTDMNEYETLAHHNWVKERLQWFADDDQQIYRLQKGGMYLYTANMFEAVSASTAGWTYEGLLSGSMTPNGHLNNYRAYNPASGEHVYSADVNEVLTLARLGWQFEGSAWISNGGSGSHVHRVYNPASGEHHYTKDNNEIHTLCTKGWIDEGTKFYSSSDTPIYRVFNPASGEHHYTKDTNERNVLVKRGWTDEGVAWTAVS
jgi:hypothetical protein